MDSSALFNLVTKPFIKILLCALMSLAATTAGNATETTLPAILGENLTVLIEPGVSLIELAVQSGVGFQALQNANPDVDIWIPAPGTQVIIPKRAIFPGKPSPGLTINLAEMRVFHLSGESAENEAGCYPMGIGRDGRDTPEGDYQIIDKVENPVWRVPGSIRAVKPELPDFVPAGPDNPLGKYWLGLSIPGYGLHGTNRPFGVGRRVSHGCIRLYDRDIRTLYRAVEPGARVRIVYQPVKAASTGKDLLLEVHPDYLHRYPDLFQLALHQISRTGWGGDVDYEKVLALVEEQRGIPEKVGTR